MYDIQVGPNECGQELVSKGRGTIWIGQDPTVSILQKLVCQIRNRVIIIIIIIIIIIFERIIKKGWAKEI
jgi:hypothetical protein